MERTPHEFKIEFVEASSKNDLTIIFHFKLGTEPFNDFFSVKEVFSLFVQRGLIWYKNVCEIGCEFNSEKPFYQKFRCIYSHRVRAENLHLF